ncbi:MAG: hypothetical protein V7731_21145 [Amphritea sp.]
MKYTVMDKRTNRHLGDITLSSPNFNAAVTAARLNWHGGNVFVKENR